MNEDPLGARNSQSKSEYSGRRLHTCRNSQKSELLLCSMVFSVATWLLKIYLEAHDSKDLSRNSGENSQKSARY